MRICILCVTVCFSALLTHTNHLALSPPHSDNHAKTRRKFLQKTVDGLPSAAYGHVRETTRELLSKIAPGDLVKYPHAQLETQQ